MPYNVEQLLFKQGLLIRILSGEEKVVVRAIAEEELEKLEEADLIDKIELNAPSEAAGKLRKGEECDEWGGFLLAGCEEAAPDLLRKTCFNFKY